MSFLKTINGHLFQMQIMNLIDKKKKTCHLFTTLFIIRYNLNTWNLFGLKCPCIDGW